MKFWLSIPFFVVALAAPICAQDSLAEKLSESFTQVAKEALPAVVFIKVEYEDKEAAANTQNDAFDFFQDDFFRRFFGDPRLSPFGQRKKETGPRFGQGSGVIVSSDGVILTNNHVVENGHKILIQLNDGREFEAKVLGLDPQTDLGVIKIDLPNAPFLPLADSSKLKVGEWAIAAGNPLGLQASITVGVVSATGRANLDIANFEDFIQTDAAINRGNSGGPLLNLKGEVIGINTAIASSTGGYMGIGFAIPSNMAKEILRQIVERGSVLRGFLGVALQPITNDLAEAFNLKKIEGALIADVSAGSPAAAAGLQRGDVIMAFNGKTVESIATFRNEVALMPPGTEVNLVIKRNNTLQNFVVVLGTHPGTEQKKEPETAETPTSTFGMTVEKLTSELATAFGITEDEGVVVTKIDPRGAAALVGIKQGALIIAVNQQKITSVESFKQAIAKKDEKGGTLLLLKQDGAFRYVYLKGKM